MAYKDREVRRAAEHARASEKRAALAAYKVEVGCIDCGYNEDARALEFDHINPEMKERNVASLMYAAWDVIWAEVAKCDVVCANHHAIRTLNRLGL